MIRRARADDVGREGLDVARCWGVSGVPPLCQHREQTRATIKASRHSSPLSPYGC